MAIAAQQEKFKQIRIFVPDKTTLDRVWSTGIDYEGVTGKIGGWMEFVAGDYELRQLAAKEFSYQVVIEDLAAHYQRRLTKGPVNALGFGLGSMGGFYTYAEVVRQLDTMRLLYPTLITVKDSIGNSREGRALWVVKISDNPEINEAGEPEVLYTALHHAREPEGMMAVLYYMWWLLESYGPNPEATYLVNNRQMYFIPVVNPDGYVYNQATYPNGGGMWRKNRRNNGDGTYGVDPNRNYGPYFMWNAPNGGSSTSTGSETYRGTAPFSEPENQTIDRFMRAHSMKTALNYHTYSNLLIFPWGYLSRENGDSLIYRDWVHDMTSVNRYTSGTDLQTVGYSTRGNSDDYMFGDSTKPSTYTMTPEVGTTGFWPSTGEIFPLAIENLTSNKLLSYFAGPYPTLRHHEIQDAGGNGFIDRNESFSLVIRVKNRGLSQAINLSVTVSTSTPYIVFPTPTVTISTMAPQVERQFVFAGQAAANAVTGIPFRAYLTYSDPQGFMKRDTLNLFLGTPTVVFADSASIGTGNWTTGAGWGLTASAHTPPNAFTDSPVGSYAANANNPLTLVSQVSLFGYQCAQLKFWTKWAIEPTWDFATVELSTNNGSTWTTLRPRLSHSGSGRDSQQPAGSWGYDGYTPGLEWVEQDIDLSEYTGRQIRLRFRVAADAGDQRDGLYVDDIRLYGYTTNSDTGMFVRPAQFTFTGRTGRIFSDSMKILNLTSGALQISVTETTSTLVGTTSRLSQAGVIDIRSLIKKLRPAVTNAHISRSVLKKLTGTAAEPESFSTIITDDRNEATFGAADLYRVDYQLRTVPLFGTFHDFRIVLGDTPDTNIVAFLSLDTDQDFGSGAFPTPLGLGPTSRDIGSEREVLLDASGLIMDSLGFGRIPAGIVLSTATDSLVGLPFPLSISRDSVLTLNTAGTAITGILDQWLNDPDRKMNVGIVASRITENANPLPDFAPSIGHGTIGTERNVSWITEDTSSLTIPAGDSAVVHITVLAAKTPGTYDAWLQIRPTGRPTASVPVSMVVLAAPIPRIAVTPRSFSDTLASGDSTTHALSVSNVGEGQLTFGIFDTAATPWFSVVPFLGTVDSAQTTVSTVFLRTAGLIPESTYTAHFFVASDDPDSSAVPIDIILRTFQPTSVGSDASKPTEFALHQNYPNPFNPATNIKFDLPSKQFVSLRVYNLLGQEVARLVGEEIAAGRYSIPFSPSRYNLASGVYLYRIVAGNFVEVKKMVLMK